MPNTEQSIEETGIPEIEMDVEVYQMVQTAVDKTLTIADMAADAKATGEAIADLAADISGLFADVYPVGSVYITAASSLPSVISAIGTWEEIALPLTWGDIKTGSRHYAATSTGYTAGNIHMWLRTA